jgi:uncharacterized protein with PIN domain
MRLVDTSAWIEWLIASPAGKSVEVALPTRADWLVPAIVQLELAKWLAREVGEDKADQVVAFTQMCFVVRSIRRSRCRPRRYAASVGSRQPMPSFTQRPWNMKPTF